MPSPEEHSKITVEDLLRLKRAERPSPDFWAAFERDLHEKQLAALVKQEPWWHGLRRRLLVPAAYLPIGATAILALSFASLKYYSPASSARLENQSGMETAHYGSASSAATVAHRKSPVATAVVAGTEAVAVRFDDRVSVAKNEPAVTSAASEEASDRIPWNASEPAMAADSPSARFFAANLQRLEKTDPELMSGLLNGVRLTATAPRVQRTSVHAIDLGNVASNLARRTRIIPVDLSSARQYAPEPSAPELVRERNARRLADTDISNQISRLDVRGDRLSFKL